MTTAIHSRTTTSGRSVAAPSRKPTCASSPPATATSTTNKIGEFRLDLLYRLAVVPEMPELRHGAVSPASDAHFIKSGSDVSASLQDADPRRSSV